jgi:hypothetical protein
MTNDFKDIIMKKGCFAIGLATHRILYVVSVIRQVARVARIIIHCIYGATHYNSNATLSQQLFFNYYATPL